MPNIKKIIVGVGNGVGKQVRPKGKREPGVNTLLYYNFENTSGTTETNLAPTGSTYNGIYNSTPTIGTLASGKKYLQCDDTTYVVASNVPMDFSHLTLFVWGYRPNFSDQNIAFGTSRRNATDEQIICSNYQNRAYDVCFGSIAYPFSNNVFNSTGWHCLVFTNDGTNSKWYIDGSLRDTKTGTNTSATRDFYVGNSLRTGYIRPSYTFNGYIGCVGFENKTRIADEVSEYVDQTKSNYGL